MPSIKNAELSITTDRPQNRATVVVSADIEFTDVEVNAMEVLGLRYSLDCRVLNKHLIDDDPMLTFHAHSYPRERYGARHYERAVFETNVDMDSLHEQLLGKDNLVAELRLKNQETGTEDVARTDAIAVDLAA
jgi:hypothetical protein